MRAVVPLLFLVGGCAAGTPSGNALSAAAPMSTGTPGYRVDGRFLRDRCGEKVVLRGVNEMIVWSETKDGEAEFAEIAKTGANSVRIVWTTKDGAPSQLDVAIQNALKHQLLPIIELHDATGDLSKLSFLVDYWVTTGMLAIIAKYERELIVNIGNEVGDHQVTSSAFEAAYKEAITRMRAAGIRTPLMVDASQWGQDIDALQKAGPALQAHDPLHNLLFSVHTWWDDPKGVRVKAELAESVELNLPLVVGEFAHHAVHTCDQAPFDFRTMLAEAQRLEIGWLAWSWGAVPNGDCKDAGPFDMTKGGTFEGLQGWGLEVAVTDPNSIQKTSKTPTSLKTGHCE